MAAKLLKKIIYTGNLVVKTGLHIGGTNASLNIGGPDKFVVRNPLTNIPYIPGSSLKGKLRSLLELALGETSNGKPSNDVRSKSGALFGVAGDNDSGHPSRLIVRDAEMATEADSKEELGKYGLTPEMIPDYSNTDLPFTESKTEVSIGRITAKSNPRTFERVPAGAQFKVQMVLNVFDDDDEKSLKDSLHRAIALLHDDYLGGQGSRGYGQVKISFTQAEGVTKTY